MSIHCCLPVSKGPQPETQYTQVSPWRKPTASEGNFLLCFIVKVSVTQVQNVLECFSPCKIYFYTLLKYKHTDTVLLLNYTLSKSYCWNVTLKCATIFSLCSFFVPHYTNRVSTCVFWQLATVSITQLVSLVRVSACCCLLDSDSWNMSSLSNEVRQWPPVTNEGVTLLLFKIYIFIRH